MLILAPITGTRDIGKRMPFEDHPRLKPPHRFYLSCLAGLLGMALSSSALAQSGDAFLQGTGIKGSPSLDRHRFRLLLCEVKRRPGQYHGHKRESREQRRAGNGHQNFLPIFSRMSAVSLDIHTSAQLYECVRGPARRLRIGL